MIRIKELKKTLVDLLISVTPDSGYVTVMHKDRVFAGFSQLFIQNKLDESYPKLAVVTESGIDENLPGERQTEDIVFEIVFVAKDMLKGLPISDQTEDFVDDIRRLVQLNHTLRNQVVDVTMTGFKTDTGYLFPEGVAVVSLLITRQNGEWD